MFLQKWSDKLDKYVLFSSTHFKSYITLPKRESRPIDWFPLAGVKTISTYCPRLIWELIFFFSFFWWEFGLWPMLLCSVSPNFWVWWGDSGVWSRARIPSHLQRWKSTFWFYKCLICVGISANLPGYPFVWMSLHLVVWLPGTTLGVAALP